MTYLHAFIERVKNDEITRVELEKIYAMYKRHSLTKEEKNNVDNIIRRIKSNELTEEILQQKAYLWLKGGK